MADERTRICGSTEESIFRRSRGSSPYFAISSDFLNSPDTSVTDPLASNSVQRSFRSAPELDLEMERERLNS
jgi:hypothetical protein